MDWNKIICYSIIAFFIVGFIFIVYTGVMQVNECESEEGHRWDSSAVDCIAPKVPPADCNVYYELEEIPCWGNACGDDWKVIWKADCSKMEES